MKKLRLIPAAAVLAVPVALGLLAAAPAVSPGQDIREVAQDPVWPMPSPNEWYWHRPDDRLTQAQVDAALSGVKSGFFWSVTNDWKGPLVKAAANKRAVEFSYTAGRELKLARVSPKLLASLRLYYAASQPQGQKWLVTVNLTTQSVIQVYFESETLARAFIDAAASAANLAGITLEEKLGRGFAVSDLTPVQAQALGKSRVDSALVSMLAFGGPAEMAGLRLFDLITEVDGVKVRNADHLVTILDAAPPGAELRLTCLERVEAADGEGAARVWKPRTVVWRTPLRP
ncbi:MAG: PDZ domain-containing protein [Candidatus Aminicenantes bacterium]|nr:PDZ domain-containing protein [Candidatus Aminicenantes bacterium]